MRGGRTLVVAAGSLLRVRAATERSSVLEVVRHGRKPQTWRVVPTEHVARHADEWAAERGVEKPQGGEP